MLGFDMASYWQPSIPCPAEEEGVYQVFLVLDVGTSGNTCIYRAAGVAA